MTQTINETGRKFSWQPIGGATGDWRPFGTPDGDGIPEDSTLRAIEGDLEIRVRLRRERVGWSYGEAVTELQCSLWAGGTTWGPWASVESVNAARPDWRGTGAPEERIYDLAAHLLNAARPLNFAARWVKNHS